MADPRARILHAWRAEYAALLASYKPALDSGDQAGAQSILRKMRALEKAIKQYTEDKLGEFRAAGERRQAATEKAGNKKAGLPL